MSAEGRQLVVGEVVRIEYPPYRRLDHPQHGREGVVIGVCPWEPGGENRAWVRVAGMGEMCLALRYLAVVGEDAVW